MRLRFLYYKKIHLFLLLVILEFFHVLLKLQVHKNHIRIPQPLCFFPKAIFISINSILCFRNILQQFFYICFFNIRFNHKFLFSSAIRLTNVSHHCVEFLQQIICNFSLNVRTIY